jgi:hypothetical protein
MLRQGVSLANARPEGFRPARKNVRVGGEGVESVDRGGVRTELHDGASGSRGELGSKLLARELLRQWLEGEQLVVRDGQVVCLADYAGKVGALAVAAGGHATMPAAAGHACSP